MILKMVIKKVVRLKKEVLIKMTRMKKMRDASLEQSIGELTRQKVT